MTTLFRRLARHLTNKGNIEQHLRLLIAAALLVIGTATLILGFETAFRNDDNGFYRPADGDIVFISTAMLAFTASWLGNRLRLLAWSMTIFLAWWTYSTIDWYSRGLFWAMGRDGCPNCGEKGVELSLGIGVFGVACAVWALATRRTPTVRWLSIVVLLPVWFVLLMANSM